MCTGERASALLQEEDGVLLTPNQILSYTGLHQQETGVTPDC